MGINVKGSGKKVDLANYRRAWAPKPQKQRQQSLRERVRMMVDAGLLEKDVQTRLESSGSLSETERKKLVDDTKALCRKAKDNEVVRVRANELQERIEGLFEDGVFESSDNQYLRGLINDALEADEYQESRRLIAKANGRVGELENRHRHRPAKQRRARPQKSQNGLRRLRGSPYATIVSDPSIFSSYAQFEEECLACYKDSPNRWFYGLTNVEDVRFDKYGVSVFESPRHFFEVVSQLSVSDLNRLKDVAVDLSSKTKQIFDEDSIRFLWQKRYVVEDVLLDHETVTGAAYSANDRLVIKMFVHRLVSVDDLDNDS